MSSCKNCQIYFFQIRSFESINHLLYELQDELGQVKQSISYQLRYQKCAIE